MKFEILVGLSSFVSVITFLVSVSVLFISVFLLLLPLIHDPVSVCFVFCGDEYIKGLI